MATNITKEIHNQFIETLKQAEWMDIISREASIDKANAIKFIFGYSNELMNDTLINEYYKDWEFNKTDTYLHNMLRSQRSFENHKIAKLRIPVQMDNWSGFETMAARVGAYLFLRQNRLCA